MRKQCEYPCILASTILMLLVSAKSKRAFGQKMLTPAVSKAKLDSLCSLACAERDSTWILSQKYWEQLIKKISQKPRVTDVSRTTRGLCYTFDNGNKLERCGGSIAWRNNNPGCLRYSEKSIKMGAIGKAFGFAVFPDEETGMRAIKILLQSDSYYTLTIEQAIHKYAPPFENNTEKYIRSLCKNIKVSRYTKICDLNDEQLNQMVKMIRRIEGWTIGTENRTYADKQPETNTPVVTFLKTKQTKENFIRQTSGLTM